MAIELGKHLEEVLRRLPKDHPDRKFLRGIHQLTDAYSNKTAKLHPREIPMSERSEILASRLQDKLGSLPDETSISSVVPPFVHTRRSTGRVGRGPHEGLTRLEIMEDFLEWRELYLESDSIDRGYLSRLTILNSRKAKEAGLITVGDIRSATPDRFNMYGFLGATTKLIKLSFSPPESEQITP